MKTGTVFVRQTNPRQRNVPPDIRKALDPRLEVVLQGDPRMYPRADGWDFYLTRAALNARTESAAAEMGVPIIVLPEGATYLADLVHKITDAGRDVWLFQPSFTGDRA